MSEIAFLMKIIAGLKGAPRVGWNEKGRKVPEAESDADHSFGVTMFALRIALDREHFPEIDPFRLLAMCLCHELVEFHEGDSGAHHQTSDPAEKARLLQLKKERELRAMAMIRDELGPFGIKLEELWLEFEERKTPEARLAKDLDRIETAFQAYMYHRDGHRSDPERFYIWARSEVQDHRLVAMLELSLLPLIQKGI